MLSSLFWDGEYVTSMILMPAEQCILGFKIRTALRTDIVGMDKWDREKREKRNVVQTFKKGR